VCLNLQEVTALWQFNGHSDGNLDIVVLKRLQSKGGTNNFMTEAALVIKGRVVQVDQTLLKRPSIDRMKVSFGALGNLCIEPVELQVPESTMKKIRRKHP
jgi:hypothetical protein